MGGKTKEAKEKPLEKMTATELRDVAKELDGIVGASGMNKDELIDAIRTAKGIEAPAAKKRSGNIRELKKKIRELKARREEALQADDARMAGIYRKRIIRMKKKTRRAA